MPNKVLSAFFKSYLILEITEMWARLFPLQIRTLNLEGLAYLVRVN